MTIRELLSEAVAKILANNQEERAAYELLKACLKKEPYEIYAMLDEKVELELFEEYHKKLAIYLSGKPLQYVLGYETFFGRDLLVNEKVLIPRYETEELVENVLYHIDDYFEDYEEITLVDIGCGSGAIALTLALEEPKTKVIATDLSVAALQVATENAQKFNAEITFLQGDLLQPLIDKQIKVDILVSNPPYLPDDEPIATSVKDYEPNLALFGGNEGLDFYQRIFKEAKQVLKERALLAFEIGYKQKDELIKLAQSQFGDCEITVLKDINGKDRLLFIYQNIKE